LPCGVLDSPLCNIRNFPLTVFQAEPEFPPSRAQASVKSQVENKGFVASVKQLMMNYGYALLLVSYGINIGVFYAISTLLNDVVQNHFPSVSTCQKSPCFVSRPIRILYLFLLFQSSADAGRIGLTIVLAGMLGSVMCGVALDATGKFK